MKASLKQGTTSPSTSLRPTAPCFMFLAVIASLALLPIQTRAGINDGNAMSRQFIWEQANARMSCAHEETEFLAAARIYERLVDSGVRNGHLFFNLGTALMKGGAHQEAVDVLLRAERYTGANVDIRRNLEICVSTLDKGESFSLPWYRPILFWHYNLPASARMSVAAIAFSGLWLALLLHALGISRLAVRVAAISFVALILFGSSAITSIHQEARADNARQLAQLAIQEATE